MHSRFTPLLLAALASLALTQTTNPKCIDDCSYPFSSHCDGGETGTALDRCTCASWMGGTADKMIACIKTCPKEDQSVFVGGSIPELCREELFPGVEASNETAAETTSAGTPSSTGGGGSSPTTNGSPSTTTNAGVAQRANSVLAVGGLLAALLF
ncbi:hypothetical protein QBC39DRAFT_357941 [Podospora conica]|nr:hypothetical protein QBC39DRAFT_357941 [Schizothecium conicum]